MNTSADTNRVMVNGQPVQMLMQECTRCVQDSTVPGISFDKDGICNFCHAHADLLQIFPNDTRGETYLHELFTRMKADRKDRPYDCVVGISGGRDSSYLLWCCVKIWGLRPLAVHFNDGFDNPVAGENMLHAVEKLGVKLITITSDWREGKDLKITFLKASTPDLNLGTDIGIASSLYSVAYKENIKYILIGQSFRTEGIKPLSWAYFDGDYLRSVQKQLGLVPLRPWKAEDPGFNFGVKELFFYSTLHGIKTFTPFYYFPYIRKEAEEIIKNELNWVYPGAHYFDDLYHSLIKYVHRVKFNIDMNMNSDSALVRSGQLDRQTALNRKHGVYAIEDERVIDLCIKRLGLKREEFEAFMKLPAKTFRDYRTSYPLIRLMRFPIYLASKLNFIPKITYYKYFKFGR
jgi:N-acetyl sugar amidotransferase